MKLNFLILFTSVSICVGGESDVTPAQVPPTKITTKQREVRDGGQVIASVETVYRGKDRILDSTKYMVARGNYAAGGRFRIYRVGGKPVLLEEDYKGDGNVTIRVFGRSGSLEDFEVFKRQSNGSIEPVSSAELARLKREDREMGQFSESFARWVSDELKTNSPEKVMSDVKKVGDALTKAQEAIKEQNLQDKK